MSRMISTAFALGLSLVLPTAAFSHHVEGAKDGGIEIHAPYSRATLPGAKVGGGHLNIINNGDDDRLIGAKSDRAERVEIHEMKMDRGIMQLPGVGSSSSPS